MSEVSLSPFIWNHPLTMFYRAPMETPPWRLRKVGQSTRLVFLLIPVRRLSRLLTILPGSSCIFR